jgi:hypothetical protein
MARKRVQLSVDPDLLEQWEKAAARASVPLNAWVMLQIQRPDTPDSLVTLLRQTESMEAHLHAIFDLLRGAGPEIVGWANSISETLESMLGTSNTLPARVTE